MNVIYDRNNYFKLQRLLGKRPGDKILDPYYLRTGIGDQPYFWNDERKKWERVSQGDMFTIHEDGSVTRTPVTEVSAA